MPKRPCNDELFEQQVSRRRRRFVIYSDSDSEPDVPEIENNEEIETPINNESTDTNPDDGQTGQLTSTSPAQPNESISLPPQVSNETEFKLDQDILLALGDPAEDTPVFGEKIPAYIADRWNPILRKGLTKDLKNKLLEEHNVPDNCRLLKAPCLNPEIGSAVAEVVRARDKKIELRQNQLGQGITAVSKAMAMLINNEGNKPEVIKLLSEGCRILSNLHFVETQVRSKLITPCLDKSFLTIINDEVRDDTLFGNKLSEKIKAAKSIEKQGLQIKKITTVPSKFSPQQQNTPKSRQTGNWNPPPRYPSSANRGGRGGAYASRSTHNTSYRRFQASSSAPVQSQTVTSAPPPPPRQQTASRSRAPARQ